MSITLTAAMRANLLSLQGTADLLSTTQLRLSTGRKVNSALDNPTAYFASQALTNRASDVSALLDGMGQSIQVMKAADQGIQSMTTLVKQAQSIANAARSKVGSGTAAGTATSGWFDTVLMQDLTDNTTTSALTEAADGDSFTLNSSATNIDYTFVIHTGDTLQDLVDAVNGVSDFHASIENGTGANLGSSRLVITTTDAAASVTVTDVTNTPAAGFGITTDNTHAGTAAGDITAEKAQYNEVVAQINNLILDTGYQGTNLLNGDTLVTQFNEDNTTSQTITGLKLDQAGLGIDANATSWASTASIDTSLNKITDALTLLRTEASRYGNNLSVIQTRQDFAKNLINVLQEGSDKLTIADKNEEGANMLALQTSQQIGIQALSLASQANQSVLRLFA